MTEENENDWDFVPPPKGGTNGYARIREVYQLFRENEERLERRLDAMEERLMLAVKDARTCEDARWDEHIREYRELNAAMQDHIEEAAQIAEATKIYRSGQLAVPKTGLRVLDWIERHWRSLTFIVVLMGMLLGISDHFPFKF